MSTWSPNHWMNLLPLPRMSTVHRQLSSSLLIAMLAHRHRLRFVPVLIGLQPTTAGLSTAPSSGCLPHAALESWGAPAAATLALYSGIRGAAHPARAGRRRTSICPWWILNS